MTDDERQARYEAYLDRVFRDDTPMRSEPSDWTTSTEAVAVLKRDGVEAWRAWCADHAPTA